MFLLAYVGTEAKKSYIGSLKFHSEKRTHPGQCDSQTPAFPTVAIDVQFFHDYFLIESDMRSDILIIKKNQLCSQLYLCY